MNDFKETSASPKQCITITEKRKKEKQHSSSTDVSKYHLHLSRNRMLLTKQHNPKYSTCTNGTNNVFAIRQILQLDILQPISSLLCADPGILYFKHS